MTMHNSVDPSVKGNTVGGRQILFIDDLFAALGYVILKAQEKGGGLSNGDHKERYSLLLRTGLLYGLKDTDEVFTVDLDDGRKQFTYKSYGSSPTGLRSSLQVSLARALGVELEAEAIDHDTGHGPDPVDSSLRVFQNPEDCLEKAKTFLALPVRATSSWTSATLSWTKTQGHHPSQKFARHMSSSSRCPH